MKLNEQTPGSTPHTSGGPRVHQDPLVHQLFRAVLPFRGVERSTLFVVVAVGDSFRSGPVVRIRIVGTSFNAPLSPWVPREDLELLIRVGACVPVTSADCGVCGGTMTYVPNGEVDGRRQPFFACDACEWCQEV